MGVWFGRRISLRPNRENHRIRFCTRIADIEIQTSRRSKKKKPTGWYRAQWRRLDCSGLGSIALCGWYRRRGIHAAGSILPELYGTNGSVWNESRCKGGKVWSIIIDNRLGNIGKKRVMGDARCQRLVRSTSLLWRAQSSRREGAGKMHIVEKSPRQIWRWKMRTMQIRYIGEMQWDCLGRIVLENTRYRVGFGRVRST